MADSEEAVKIPRHYAPILRHLYVAAVHLLLFILSFWLAYALRYEFRLPPFAEPIPDVVEPGAGGYVSDFTGVPVSLWSAFPKLLVFVLVVKLLVFGYFRLYAGWWQYASIQDLIETFKASHISTFLIIAGIYLFKGVYR